MEDKQNNSQTMKVQIQEDWILLEDNAFTCVECENTSTPLTNTEEGMVDADLDQIVTDLTQFPTKIIYGICPVCGMEYVFKLAEDKLYLEPSYEEK